MRGAWGLLCDSDTWIEWFNVLSYSALTNLFECHDA